MNEITPALLATADRPLLVTYTAVASLTPDPRNARTHPKRQVEQIVASIRAFGFTNPILADERGRLIAGHGRLLAAKEIGLAEVPVITLRGLSEAQQKALRLADNKIALNAGWDVEILKLELAELSLPAFEMDLSLTGFASGEIDVILADSADSRRRGDPAGSHGTAHGGDRARAGACASRCNGDHDVSSASSTLFQKGQSGNPKGRPRKRPVEASAFDVVLDRTLTVTQNGVARELTVDEALQLQTYQAALKGGRMAIRAVLKMIEQREVARARRAPATPQISYSRQVEYDTDNAHAAMQILDIAQVGDRASSHTFGEDLKLSTWVAEAALERRRGFRLSDRAINLLKRHIRGADRLTWPLTRR